MRVSIIFISRQFVVFIVELTVRAITWRRLGVVDAMKKKPGVIHDTNKKQNNKRQIETLYLEVNN